MQNDSFLIKIDLTPEYQRNLKNLAKKYRNIRSDTQSFITELQKGNLLGDRLTGFDEDIYIYKARVKNSNLQKVTNMYIDLFLDKNKSLPSENLFN